MERPLFLSFSQFACKLFLIACALFGALGSEGVSDVELCRFCQNKAVPFLLSSLETNHKTAVMEASEVGQELLAGLVRAFPGEVFVQRVRWDADFSIIVAALVRLASENQGGDLTTVFSAAVCPCDSQHQIQIHGKRQHQLQLAFARLLNEERKKGQERERSATGSGSHLHTEQNSDDDGDL